MWWVWLVILYKIRNTGFKISGFQTWIPMNLKISKLFFPYLQYQLWYNSIKLGAKAFPNVCLIIIHDFLISFHSIPNRSILMSYRHPNSVANLALFLFKKIFVLEYLYNIVFLYLMSYILWLSKIKFITEKFWLDGSFLNTKRG